jgi:hypothetical protein
MGTHYFEIIKDSHVHGNDGNSTFFKGINELTENFGELLSSK